MSRGRFTGVRGNILVGVVKNKKLDSVKSGDYIRNTDLSLTSYLVNI